MKTQMILAALPALNEEATIAVVLAGIPREIGGHPVWVLVVDDGSTDRTAELARAAGAFVISHGRKMGLGDAFRTMLGFAREGGYHFLATIDADGQFDPGHLPVLAAPVLSGQFDFATASRFADPSLTPRMPRLKRMGNRWVARLVSRLSGVGVKDATCGFRFYGPRALDKVSCLSRFTYTQEVVIDLAMKGMRIREVPLSIRGERASGKSRIAGNRWRYAVLSTEAMYSVAHGHSPWRIYGGPALVLMGTGVIMDLFVFAHWLSTGRITPFAGLGIGGLFLITFSILLLLFASVADIGSSNRKLLESLLETETKRKRKHLQAVSREDRDDPES
jgi:glycosyltransferase involved in cell wall biosynthesis